MKAIQNFAVIFSAVMVLPMAGCSEKAETKTQLVSKDCWLGFINGHPEATVHSAPEIITFGGWAADSTTSSAPTDMAIKITDSDGKSFLFRTNKRISRPDVVAATKRPGYIMAGYNFSVDGASLVSGEYGVSIEMYRQNEIISCSTTKRLIIN